MDPGLAASVTTWTRSLNWMVFSRKTLKERPEQVLFTLPQTSCLSGSVAPGFGGIKEDDRTIEKNKITHSDFIISRIVLENSEQMMILVLSKFVKIFIVIGRDLRLGFASSRLIPLTVNNNGPYCDGVGQVNPKRL